MNNLYKLMIFFPILIFGCSSNLIEDNKMILKKIDNLSMDIFSYSGDKIYSISSPNSTYDNYMNLIENYYQYI